MQKPELISPAGDLEKLKIAFQYGADAVYASTPKFSMRTREIGFNEDTIKEGIEYAHKIGKKIYLTLNVFPHPSEIEAMKEHALNTIQLKPDAIIAADPGVISFLKENTDIPIHLSTQASTTNQLSASFWHKQGISRIVLARELSLKDIKLMTNFCHSEQSEESPLQLEAFVHGAMCMAYSGRCQISNYLVGRDPNRGACVQPCRFKYKMYALEEELRKGEFFPVLEDDHGSYIFNSKDLCMIRHLPELIDSGIQSFKIEGRLKSIYYVAMVTKTYRQAINLFFDDPKKYEFEKDNFYHELEKISNRDFTTGFYFHTPDQNTNNYERSKSLSDWGFIGLVHNYDKKLKLATVEVKNRLTIGQEVEIITPEKLFKYDLKKMEYNGQPINEAHANYLIQIPIDHKLSANSFLRVKTNAKS